MIKVNRYEIFLDFSFQTGDYKGYEKIEMESDEETVVLDAVGLKILKVKVNEKEIKFSQDESKVNVKSGSFSGILEVEFEGKVAERKLVGIYKASYKDGYVISTQFEATHARDFIPCFDHPAMKAKFKLIVRVDKGLKVISNMPVVREKEENGKLVYEFDETPRMSTYLLYLGIGNFEEIKDEGKIPTIIVATIPGKVQKGRFSMQISRNSIEFYGKYFEIPYQLPKVHLIAIPEFAYGAMENWGAITFRETALLADDSSSVYQKFRVAEVVAHELAHQWFGNLVTLKWWDDLWLNESFATFMSHKAISQLFPSWNFWGYFVLNQTSKALEKDSVSTTHPIEAHVKDPNEVEQMFDDISYGKGASILRMIEAYVGEENFRRGVVNYLKKFSYSNAQGSDLWNSISEVYGSNISPIMADWITKPGYPMVRVSVSGNRVNLEQERFSVLGNVENLTYKIPLTMEVNGKIVTHLLDKERETITFEEDIKSFKANVNRTGFYRVLYNSYLVFNAKLSELDKWGIINDYWAFLLAGKIDFKEYERIISKFFNDKDFLPVNELSNELFTLYAINPDKYQGISKEFHRIQLKNWRDSKDELGRLTYSNILYRLAAMDDEFSLGLSEMFRFYDSLDSDTRQGVAVAYAITYEEDAIDELLERYRKESFDEEKLRYLTSMLFFRKPYLVGNTLSLILSGEIKKQDIPYTLSVVSYNPYAKSAVLSWIKMHVNFMREAYKGTGILGRRLAEVIPLIGIGAEKETEQFFSNLKMPEGERGIRTGLELLKAYSRLK
ncbi:Peptidase M1 membrane alanine aminopeptidase [Sulfolobus islandicus M.14.25]|uniref:Aminopeptidase n=1 Tax=Saccharolobus islandicus (strain M.14.25 / Kamchatka \|nr:M1 family metallopeptidase [Sulfolobus islandicus]ACP39472.1 Peptidase M1 membrane alanine aminopeptidase [Sulfolobus islandicus M.14.25]